MVVYKDNNDSNKGKAVIGKVSGTTITMGSIQTYDNSSSTYNQVIALSSDKIAISHNSKITIATVSDTTMSFGSDYTISSGMFHELRALSSDKIIICYRNTSGYGACVVGEVKGTVLSLGSATVFNSSNTYYSYPSAISADKVLISYDDISPSDGNHGKAVIGTISGKTIVYSSPSVIDAEQVRSSCLVSPDKAVFLYFNGAKVGSILPYLGVAQSTATGGQSVSVAIKGIASGLSGKTAGLNYYTGANGTMTTTMYPDRIGTAVSSSEIILDGKWDGGDSMVSDLQFRNGFRFTEFQTNATQGLALYDQVSKPVFQISELGKVSATRFSIGSSFMFTESAPSDGLIVEGMVGIGVDDPTAKLHLGGIAGTVSFEINSNETTSGNNIIMARSDVGGDDDPVFRVQADGAVYADGAYTGTGADYAEYFENEENIPVQSLVGLNKKTGKVRKYKAGDILIGVVSEKPGFVGNGGYDKENNSNYTLVALTGQVFVDPEEVEIESGVVKTLDGREIGYTLSDSKILLSIRHYNLLTDAGNDLGGVPSGIADGHAFGVDGGLFWNIESKLLGLGTNDPSAKLNIVNGDVSVKGMIIKSAQNQIANLSEWQDSQGSLILAVTADGKLSFGGRSNLYSRAEGVLATDGSLEVGGDLTLSGVFSAGSSEVQTLNSDSQIDPKNTKIKIQGGGEDVTIYSKPSVKAGKDNQILIIQGSKDSNKVILQSDSVMDGSGLRLGEGRRVMGGGDILTIIFDANDNIWYEINYSNN